MATNEFADNGAEKQAHTPGPWHVVTMRGWGGLCIGRRPQDEADKTAGDAPIAKVIEKAPHWQDAFPAEANARLIAAAPDLAAVCRAYEAWEADLILNADWSNELPRMTQAQYDRLMEIQAMRNAALAKAEGAANG